MANARAGRPNGLRLTAVRFDKIRSLALAPASNILRFIHVHHRDLTAVLTLLYRARRSEKIVRTRINNHIAYYNLFAFSVPATVINVWTFGRVSRRSHVIPNGVLHKWLATHLTYTEDQIKSTSFNHVWSEENLHCCRLRVLLKNPHSRILLWLLLSSTFKERPCCGNTIILCLRTVFLLSSRTIQSDGYIIIVLIPLRSVHALVL